MELPKFFIKNPKLWLNLADSYFKLAQINEEKQYYLIIMHLPQDVIEDIIDVVKEKYCEGALALLKETLINRYEPSKEQKIREVLDTKYDPSQLPSEFFEKIISKAKDLLPYEQVLQGFKEQLPVTLAVAITPMIKCLAQKYEETKTRDLLLEQTMMKTTDIISYLQSLNSSRTSDEINRRRTNFREDGPWCKIHFLYGDEARKCSRPGNCSFKL